MEIRKRNGESVPFQQEKIFNAMKKAFDGQGKEIGSREMDEILATVLNNLSVTVPLTVERVQDEVERTLMERGHYEVAKAYILYREKRSALRRVRHTIARTVGDDSLDEVLRRIQMDFTEEVYSLAALQMKFESFCRPGMTEDERAEALTKAAVELTTAEAPKWEFIAARLLNHSFRCRNAQEWEGRGVCDLYGKLRYLTDKPIAIGMQRNEMESAPIFRYPSGVSAITSVNAISTARITILCTFEKFPVLFIKNSSCCFPAHFPQVKRK